MLEVQPQDSRGYFMLPQAPEGAGYYVYGTPENGASQYADPRLITRQPLKPSATPLCCKVLPCRKSTPI